MTPDKFRIDRFPSTVLDARSGVPDSLGVWRRDDTAEVETLDPVLFADIMDVSMRGALQMQGQEPLKAQGHFLAAMRRLPEPLGRWNAAGWLLLALGHACVVRADWPLARQVLTDAMWSPGVFGNPWAHRLKGQAHFALQELDRAADDLLRAYQSVGHAILEGTPPGCLTLIEETVRNATAAQSAAQSAT